MKVAFENRGPVEEPYLKTQRELCLGMQLRPGSMEMGLRRSAMRRVMFDAGEMGLCPPHFQYWIGSADMEHLTLTISRAVLMNACDGIGNEVELRPQPKLVDVRLRALVTAVDAERIAGFPSGRLFLDSIEQALAMALMVGYAVPDHYVRKYRAGLGPARLRRLKELVEEKMEEDLTLDDLASSVGLSTTHFSQMFRRSTGQSPHQYVLRHRIERAKEMLHAAETRVLDVAVACGFKTQQHFARVFRGMCGASPTEYRNDLLR
jgi:AraC family transcriptional regulator